ncbi:hypothetical protein JCM14076_06290 [Methylosoma difficile]
MNNMLKNIRRLRLQQIMRGDFSCKLVIYNGSIPTRKTVLAEIERLENLPVSVSKSYLQIRAMGEL